MICCKNSIRSVSLCLLVSSLTGAGALAQDSCTDPQLAALENRIQARVQTVLQARELNQTLLRERGRYLKGSTRLTYGATALATVGIGVVAGAAGAAAGGVLGFVSLDAAAGAPGLVVTGALLGKSLAMLAGGAGLGLIAGTVGGPIALANASGGDAENVTGAGEYARTQLPGWSVMPGDQLLRSIPDFISRFQEANRKVGQAAITEERSVNDNSHWYHMGWDEKKTIEIMVREHEQHLAIYDLEAQFLAAARDDVARECQTATSAAIETDSGRRTAVKPISKPAEDFIPVGMSGTARAGAGAAARIN